jgi:pseudouridine-5'-phosphate glycosidase
LPLKFTEEVQQAIRCGGPVVALESTIITHGTLFQSSGSSQMNAMHSDAEIGKMSAMLTCLQTSTALYACVPCSSEQPTT